MSGQDVTFAMPLNHGIISRLRGRKGEPPFDVLWVHGYATANALHGIVAAKALGIPVFLRADMWLRDRKRSGLKLALKQAFMQGIKAMTAGVLSVGTLNSDYWRHYFGNDFPLFLLPYAVDNEYFSQRAREAQAGRASLQAELDLDPSRPVILFASKLQTRKHCDHLIEAYLASLPRPASRAQPSVSRHCGRWRGACSPRTPGCCNRLCQHPLLRLPQPVGVAALLRPRRRIRAAIAPRTLGTDRFNEVMNAARPAIVSDDVGCAPDLIQDGVNGCIYPVGDIDALVAALHRVLDRPGAAAEMGQRAFERIQHWSFEEDIQELRRALASVVPGFAA